MREILFRGKRIDNGEWVDGGYIRIDPPPVCFAEDKDKAGKSKDCIVIETGCADWGLPRHYGMCEVDPSTIGQYTGLDDRNGKKIFEGDIVSGTSLGRERAGVIVWIDELAGFGVQYRERSDPTAWQESSILKDIARHGYSAFCAKVIGNIHDMPAQKEPPPD